MPKIVNLREAQDKYLCGVTVSKWMKKMSTAEKIKRVLLYLMFVSVYCVTMHRVSGLAGEIALTIMQLLAPAWRCWVDSCDEVFFWYSCECRRANPDEWNVTIASAKIHALMSSWDDLCALLHTLTCIRRWWAANGRLPAMMITSVNAISQLFFPRLERLNAGSIHETFFICGIDIQTRSDRFKK